MDEIFCNPSMRKTIFKPIDLLHKSEDFGPNFGNKNDPLCAWRDFKKELTVLIYRLCFRIVVNAISLSETLSQKFNPYSILS